MQFFIGVLPPGKIYNDIVRLQEKYFKPIAEPHITLKAQGGLTEDKNWIINVEEVARSIKPFKLTLNDIRIFGNSVLYFSVLSDAIYNVHKALVDVIAPPEVLIEQYFEGPLYIPHLTIVENADKLSAHDLLNLKKASEKVLADNETEFTTTTVRIYYQEHNGDKYKILKDISLQTEKAAYLSDNHD